jgi:aspartyl-tRNA(Asn)/glutamyl-tRNA(Gln) amidotransferase subunit B
MKITQSDIVKIIKDIIKNNGKTVSEYKSGKVEALQFLIGQALKETKKQADPKVIKELILKEIKQ